MAEGLEDILERMRLRVAEIDERLAGVDALMRERAQLQQAMATLTGTGPADGGSEPVRRRRGPRPGTPRPRGRSRAPRGANRQRIVEHLREAGPLSASGIAKGTGINRGVVYDNLTKLVDAGEVGQRDQDGTAVFELAPASDPAE